MNDDLNKQNMINIVNPLNPNQIVKTVELVDKREKIEEKINMEVEEPTKTEPIITNKNSGFKKFLPIIIVLVIALIGSMAFLIIQNQEKEPPLVVVNETLNNILTNLRDDVEFNKYTTSTSIVDNKLLINLTIEGQDYNYEYVLEEELNNDDTVKNKYLTTTIANDNEFNMLLLVIDAIAQTNGVEENKTYEYLKTVNFNTDNIEGIEIDDNKYKIDVTKIFDKVISYNYYTTTELEPYKDFILDGNVNIKKKDIIIYKLDNNERIVITIGQKKELNELTYNTLLSIVEVINSNDLTQFKENYTTLETKTYEKYSVVVNPIFDETLKTSLSNYLNTHKFVQLIIQKS